MGGQCKGGETWGQEKKGQRKRKIWAILDIY